MTTSSSAIAVLGLGRMGTAIAHRLDEQGWTVTGWTRSGGTEPSDAVRRQPVVVLALFDGPACAQVIERCGSALAPDTVVVNTTTMSPDEATALEKTVHATGAGYVHAPVMGSVPAVLSGGLRILVGASAPTPPAADALLAVLGEVVPAGGVAEAAALKLVSNSALGSGILALRDARRYAGELGVPPDAALDVLERGALGRLVEGKRDAAGPAHFTAAALAKDLTLLAAETSAARSLAARVNAAVDSGAVAEDADVFALTMPTDDVAAPDEVLEPLRAYVRGHATGDPAHFRKAFLPTAHVEGVRDGGFVSWSLNDYCGLFSGRPADDEAERRRRIESVQVEGTVGTATMTLWHGVDTFTDVFLLVRTDAGWRIANKVYDRC
ncbi:MAG TPA: nuclear transport factor 2 family protein [Nocardioides sp.]|nr:nuclear transport factor 2 family protein [Nocardioides sp.]